MNAVKSLIICVALSVSSQLYAQKKVTFTAADGLTITADLYRVDKYAPFIILLHRENSSRGEYQDIAFKLQKLGFSCLAVDLRYGKECNYVRNETSKQYLEQNGGIPATMLDCEKDIAAAIGYVTNIAINKRLILMGSNFSASLAMKAANHNQQVTAAIAFSPGEYFGANVPVKKWLTDFDQLLFVATTQHEYPFVTDLIQTIPTNLLTRFQPTGGNGMQGAPALWNEEPTSNEYWMSLMLFLNKVKEAKYN
ncbi:MAG: dienelactone hydrolase family protein [Bacteroidales bacterium]|jgi:dienelactone hydrolase|nr:dienelactone hydrolase family protein [Bacteroidales bacterium]